MVALTHGRDGKGNNGPSRNAHVLNHASVPAKYKRIPKGSCTRKKDSLNGVTNRNVFAKRAIQKRVQTDCSCNSLSQ